jgi:hypothetical protein
MPAHVPFPIPWGHEATPSARVESGDRSLRVGAEELPYEEAAAFWPRILQLAPGNARYQRATSRAIPLVRLVPIGPGKGALQSS